MSTTNERRDRSGVFKVKLTTLSIVLLCVTVSSLASLVVVATITKPDALSTVALALAVLAFAAQLIVTIAQAQSSAEQTRETFRINAETRSVLAEIKAQGNALVAVQASQFDKVLDRAINADTVGEALTNLADSADDGLDDDGEGPSVSGPDPEAVASELRSLIESSLTEPRKTAKTDFPTTPQVGQKEATKAVEDYLALSRGAQKLLLLLIDREAGKTRMLLRANSARRDDTEELQRAGFVSMRSNDGDRVVYLSPLGRVIGEVLDPANPFIWTRILRKRIRSQELDRDLSTED